LPSLAIDVCSILKADIEEVMIVVSYPFRSFLWNSLIFTGYIIRDYLTKIKEEA